MEKQCSFCKKDIPLSHGNRKYCSDECNDKAYYQRNKKSRKEKSKENYYKNFERDKNKRKKRFKNWYSKNKIKQKENVLKSYLKNKIKWTDRRNANRYKHEIFVILKNICNQCGNKKVKIIHHKEYGKWPKNMVRKGNKKKVQEENKLKRERYYKKYLMLFCSNLCHRGYERQKAKT